MNRVPGKEERALDGEPAGMLPIQEIDALQLLIRTAADLAKQGMLVAGYDALVAGRRRAEELRDRGAPWGPELVAWWRGAIDTYTRRHGVPLD